MAGALVPLPRIDVAACALSLASLPLSGFGCAAPSGPSASASVRASACASASVSVASAPALAPAGNDHHTARPHPVRKRHPRCVLLQCSVGLVEAGLVAGLPQDSGAEHPVRAA